MSRSTMIVRFAMLTIALSTAGVSADESGGIALAPEVLRADDAQGRVLDRVVGRLELLQQLRIFNLSGGAITSSNLANPNALPIGSRIQALDSAQNALSEAVVLRRTRGE